MIKFTVTQLDTHAHITVRSGKTPGSLGLCGKLVMDVASWNELKGTFSDDASDIIIEEPE